MSTRVQCRPRRSWLDRDLITDRPRHFALSSDLLVARAGFELERGVGVQRGRSRHFLPGAPALRGACATGRCEERAQQERPRQTVESNVSCLARGHFLGTDRRRPSRAKSKNDDSFEFRSTCGGINPSTLEFRGGVKTRRRNSSLPGLSFPQNLSISYQRARLGTVHFSKKKVFWRDPQ